MSSPVSASLAAPYGLVVGADDPALASLTLDGLRLGQGAQRALVAVLGQAAVAATSAELVPGAAVVLHDAHCPATPEESLRAVVDTADEATCAVGVRPVTDTVKAVRSAGETGETGEWLGETVDRATLVAVTSPLVVPAAYAALLAQAPDLGDLPATVAWLRERAPIRMVEVSALSRRVSDSSDVALLEALLAAPQA